MADRVLFQTDDDLSEQNITEAAARGNASDYVERGLSFAVDYTNNVIDIGSGFAIVTDGTQAYEVLPDQRTGLSLPATSGVNHVFVTIDPSLQDDISYHIDTDDTPPATPSLKVGTVDTANNTSTELNRRPDLTAGGVDIGQLSAALDAAGYDISNVGSFGAQSASVSGKVNSGSLSAEKLSSDSLPKIRLWTDSDGVIHATGENGDIDSGTDAATVIQSAVDHVHSNVTGSELGPIAVIDGGGETFTLTSGVTFKSGAVYQNMTLDANGNNGFVPLTCTSGANANSFAPSIVNNVASINSGDSNGIELYDCMQCRFYNLVSDNHGGDGIVLYGGISNSFHHLRSRKSSGSQIVVTNDGTRDGNTNAFYYTVAHGGAKGIKIGSSDQTTRQNAFYGVSAEGATNEGVLLEHGCSGTRISGGYFESNGTDIYVGSTTPRAAETVIENIMAGSVTFDQSSRGRLTHAYPGVHTDLTVDITTNAAEVRVSQLGGAATFNDSGTRTIRNFLGYNAGDPSAGGDWNGRGYEGLMVRDTTNANTYVYNNGSWSQIASA